MNGMIQVEFRRGWRAALFYAVDLLAVAALVAATVYVVQAYAGQINPTIQPAEYIYLPGDGTAVPVDRT